MSLPVAVLISGYGTNLQALMDACAKPDVPAHIAVVLSNKAGAYGLERAKAAGIPTLVLSHKDYDSREAFDQAMHEALQVFAPKLICLAGFMRLLTPWFVRQWRDALINIHPSLLPAFKGLNTHERALEAGVKLVGCTVHFVRDDMDVGPTIIQAAVPVLTGDTPQNLQDRVLAQEVQIYPKALEMFARGQLQVEHEVVNIKKEATSSEATSFIHSV